MQLTGHGYANGWSIAVLVDTMSEVSWNSDSLKAALQRRPLSAGIGDPGSNVHGRPKAVFSERKLSAKSGRSPFIRT